MRYVLFLLLISSNIFVRAQETSSAYHTDIRQELIEAFDVSEKYTLAICNQMPADFYGFRSTDSTWTFAEQWRHCCVYTAGQLAGQFGVENPYKERKLPKEMTKDEVIGEMKTLYDFIRSTIRTASDEKLTRKIDFVNGPITGWRLFYAMENHIIHHRGQCIVYLRLKGIVPVGYLGW